MFSFYFYRLYVYIVDENKKEEIDNTKYALY